MQTSVRKVIGCRDVPSDSKCTLTIAGTEDEVLKAATEHAISSHGHKAGPELVNALRSSLHSEK
jgi:predicted small metal-binding protein